MSGSVNTPSLNLVYYLKKSNTSSHIYTDIEGIMDPIKTLIDSGSSRNFMDNNFAIKHILPLTALLHPRAVIGIDGQEVEEKIKYKTTINITVEGKTLKQRCYVMPLGDTNLILGITWLQEAKPIISWEDLKIEYQEPITAKISDIRVDIPEEFQEYEDVFSEELFKKIPEHRDYDCAIDLVEDAELPKPAKAFPMSNTASLELNKHLDAEIAAGKLRETHSKVAAPCFFVPKKDGGHQLVIDYRKINAITKSDQFPIPLQSDLLDKVRDAKIFSKLDLRSGYNNIRIKKGDKWKTTFRTKNRFLEYIVMPFGLKNAPAVFQRFTNKIFEDMIDVNVVIYLDDILIYSKDKATHTEDVKKVLQRLKDHNLFLKWSKCSFYVTKVTFIGIVISPDGISMEEEKIKAVKEWPIPKTIKQVQAFLGFANFYRRFLWNFSKMAKPLTSLTQKDYKWRWGEEEQQGFEGIKKAICMDPVLVHPDPKKPYFLETDTSGVAMGAVLSQIQSDGYRHPIAFISQSYTAPQRNYDTHGKELLAIITSFKFWRLYLELTKEPIEVLTDHKNLIIWRDSDEPWNRRHARWHQFLV